MNVEKEVAALKRMNVKQLRTKYTEVFGDETKTGNKDWLVKRIAWRLQANAEGGLSERARQRADELANEADLRMHPPREKAVIPISANPTTTLVLDGDNRLPPPGSTITRNYKGQDVQVRVLPKGFEYEGTVFKSLSAVAKHVTGTHTNGYLFFQLREGDRS